MSSSLTALIAIAYHKLPGRRESPIEPFVHTAQLAEDEQAKALKELHHATNQLVDLLHEKGIIND